MKNSDFKHNEYQIMFDVWACYKKHYEVPLTDDGWDRLASDFGEISKKYPSSKLCGSLIVAFVEDIESRNGEQYKQADLFNRRTGVM